MLKIFVPAILAALLLAAPGYAQNGPQGYDQQALERAIQNCPGLNGKIDAKALAEAAAQCPGLNGAIDPALLAEAASKCPVINGRIDPRALSLALQKCPAFNGQLPAAASKCPGLNGKIDRRAFASAAKNCPALSGQGYPPAAATKVEDKMRFIVDALEGNKQSANVLIKAAREAGASPDVVRNMEEMSQAFRQYFISSVSPQQIVENLLAREPQPDGTGMIITAPDGSTWIIAPQAQPQPRPVQPAPPAVQRPAPPVPPASGPAPAPNMGGGPGPQLLPPPNAMPAPGAQAPAVQPQSQMIILEEPSMPYWPTKQQLGKDGVLKYLEKRAQSLGG